MIRLPDIAEAWVPAMLSNLVEAGYRIINKDGEDISVLLVKKGGGVILQAIAVGGFTGLFAFWWVIKTFGSGDE